MAELGVQPHIIEAVLNHVSGHKSGVAGIYNRATYDKEKREALNLWAAHLLAVIEGKRPTVVPLRRATFACRQRWGRSVAYASQFSTRIDRAHHRPAWSCGHAVRQMQFDSSEVALLEELAA
jgi:hypothetical protein